jgi:integrase
MVEVDPIENEQDLALLYKFLMKHNYVREAHLLVIGCNVALRISDLLQLTFEQLETSTAYLTEIKTGKGKVLTFNKNVFDHAKLLKAWYQSKEIVPTYLFQTVSRNNKAVKPVSSSYVNRKLSEAGDAVMLDYNIGTHSMRKFWGYHAYKNGTDIREIQKALNHTSVATTLSYIGITKKKQAKLYHNNGVSVL